MGIIYRKDGYSFSINPIEDYDWIEVSNSSVESYCLIKYGLEVEICKKFNLTKNECVWTVDFMDFTEYDNRFGTYEEAREYAETTIKQIFISQVETIMPWLVISKE